MTEASELSASLEDYLEAIFVIIQEKQGVRVKDLAARLKVKAASVTGALRVLTQKGLIHYAPYDIITLTSTGKAAARGVAARHAVLKRFLEEVLGIQGQVADKDACRLEHALSPLVLKRLHAFVEFMIAQPKTLLDEFKRSCAGK